MKRQTSTSIMNVETAVSYIENSIKAGVPAFFINTEFGKLSIETDYEDYDPVDPVQVGKWVDAPATDWCMMNHDVPCDIYVKIGVPAWKSRLYCHLRAIEAVLKSFLLKNLGVVPSQEVTDATVMTYLKYIDTSIITTNTLEREFVNANLNLITRNDPMVRNLVRNMIYNRTTSAQRVINEGESFLRSHSITITEVGSLYDYELLAIVCWSTSHISNAGVTTSPFAYFVERSEFRISN